MDQTFEESFMAKNKDLLIVFFLYEKEKTPLEYLILNTTEWIFPDGDLEIIKRDWNDIREMVVNGAPMRYPEVCILSGGDAERRRS